MHRIVRLQFTDFALDMLQHVARYGTLEVPTGFSRHLSGIVIARRFRLPDPGRGDGRRSVGTQQFARRPGFGAPFAKRSIELYQLDGHGSQVIACFVKRGFYRAGQQSKDQRREGHHHGDDELDKLDHLAAPVTFRQKRSDKQAERAAAEQNDQNQPGVPELGHGVGRVSRSKRPSVVSEERE